MIENHSNVRFIVPELTNRYLRAKTMKLCHFILGFKNAVVAYSGGVDSALVAYLSYKFLPRTLCVIEESPVITEEDLKFAARFCKRYKIQYTIIQGSELVDEKFHRNDRDRCYHCKKSLFTSIEKIRKKEFYDVIFDGSNYDDRSDFRPGRKAAIEFGVRSPLLECGFTKRDIRELSKVLKLPVWNKPAMACLASRIPYGIPITKGILIKIVRAENTIKSIGHKIVRARVHGEILRIEIGCGEKVDFKKLRKIIPDLKRQGFKYIVLDIEGYRTGSMNE